MSRIALVTGADRGLGLGITTILLEKGWRVYAGQYLPEWPELRGLADRYPEHLTLLPLDVASTLSVLNAAQIVSVTVDCVDMVVSNAGVGSPTSRRELGENQDFDEMHRLFDVNSLGAIRVVEAFLPLTRPSDMKRLCFVSSEAGSIERSTRISWFGYCMSKAALNMAVKNMFNYLRPQGYIFRLYHPGWIRSYMRGIKNTEGKLEPKEAAVPAVDYFLKEMDIESENRLVLRDYEGAEWPW
ncbi:MAG: SDR family NAD(P)-dependent oxidoreductase [Caldilineaceae bacterium]